MKTNKNTILVTGGGSGIGLEIAKLFSKENHIIITGRSEERLLKAAAGLQNVSVIPFDITNEEDVKRLVEKVITDFPNLNVLINNAGKGSVYDIVEPNVNAYQRAYDEIDTNFLSVVRLTEKLLPLLVKQDSSAIVNVTSVVAFVPSKGIATYSSSKAALHSYTESLRLALAETPVKVFELMPPLVNTEFSKEIGGENGIAPEEVALQLYQAFENETYEIRVGDTAEIYKLYFASREDALTAMNS